MVLKVVLLQLVVGGVGEVVGDGVEEDGDVEVGVVVEVVPVARGRLVPVARGRLVPVARGRLGGHGDQPWPAALEYLQGRQGI